MTVNEGSSIHVRFFADCNPSCSVVWRDGDRQKEISKGIEKNVLNIASASRNTSKQFQCYVYNNYGNKSVNIGVHVKSLPSIVPSTANKENQKTVVNITDSESGDKQYPVVLTTFVLIAAVMVVVIVVILVVWRKKRGQTDHIEETLDTKTVVRYSAGNPKTVTDVYATVQKRCEAKSASLPLVQVSIDQSDGGEQEEEKMIYVDLDLPRPTMKDGKPIINRRREAVQYGQIDFNRNPSPQLSDEGLRERV